MIAVPARKKKAFKHAKVLSTHKRDKFQGFGIALLILSQSGASRDCRWCSECAPRISYGLGFGSWGLGWEHLRGVLGFYLHCLQGGHQGLPNFLLAVHILHALQRSRKMHVAYTWANALL